MSIKGASFFDWCEQAGALEKDISMALRRNQEPPNTKKFCKIVSKILNQDTKNLGISEDNRLYAEGLQKQFLTTAKKCISTEQQTVEKLFVEANRATDPESLGRIIERIESLQIIKKCNYFKENKEIKIDPVFLQHYNADLREIKSNLGPMQEKRARRATHCMHLIQNAIERMETFWKDVEREGKIDGEKLQELDSLLKGIINKENERIVRSCPLMGPYWCRLKEYSAEVEFYVARLDIDRDKISLDNLNLVSSVADQCDSMLYNDELAWSFEVWFDFMTPEESKKLYQEAFDKTHFFMKRFDSNRLSWCGLSALILPPGPGLFNALRDTGRLRELDFSCNGLKAIPTEMGLLTGLTKLDFSGNRFLTTVPTEIGLLTTLQWLNIENNDLTTVPSEIGFLTGLKGLYLSTNRSLTTVPSEIMSLSKMCVIYLNSCPHLLRATRVRIYEKMSAEGYQGPNIICEKPTKKDIAVEHVKRKYMVILAGMERSSLR